MPGLVDTGAAQRVILGPLNRQSGLLVLELEEQPFGCEGFMISFSIETDCLWGVEFMRLQCSLCILLFLLGGLVASEEVCADQLSVVMDCFYQRMGNFFPGVSDPQACAKAKELELAVKACQETQRKEYCDHASELTQKYAGNPGSSMKFFWSNRTIDRYFYDYEQDFERYRSLRKAVPQGGGLPGDPTTPPIPLK